MDPKRSLALGGNRFPDRLKSGQLRGLAETRVGRKLGFRRQFEMSRRGDVARRMNLSRSLAHHGGWQSRLHHGHVHSSFVSIHFGSWYAGPAYYPSYCWTPHWGPWVAWSWWDTCLPVWDPRPRICRPLIYSPSRAWVSWGYPVWTPLPIVSSGTWVNVETVKVDKGMDLQLLAVRFVDAGHPEKQLGSRFRVWIRNNSDKKIRKDFNVMLLASNSREPQTNVPQAGVEVDKIDAGEIQTLDIRLPYEANVMARDSKDRQTPFSFLHVLVDSHRDIDEAFEENNGVVLSRGDVLPVDPATFSTNVTSAAPGTTVNIAGEGFGPEPGEVIVYVNKLELQAEIHGWYDLGIQIKLPMLPLAAEANAEIVVVRGDGAVSNPVPFLIVPQARPVTPPPAPVK
ncbi:MAG: hypothetical protein QF363_19495 [Planctomycetaceae bacterium]|jgi:hypothetical protein|nr:hypothetical protein [Planctomycetaceae bacterium]